MFGDTMDLNMITNKVGIVDQFLQNAKVTGIQAIQSLDRIARRALFNAYFGGNTRVTVTNGAAQTTVKVDDIRGFYQAPTNGVMAAVGGGNPLTLTVGSNAYTLIGAVADGVVTNGVVNAATVGGTVPLPLMTFSGAGSNTSTAPDGFSGTLTFSGNVTVADATLGNAVTAANASSIIRPSGRATTAALQATDTLTMQNILDGVALMRLNNVPGVGMDGSTSAAAGNEPYNLYLDPKSSRQLFADPDFKQLFQGQGSSNGTFKGRHGQRLPGCALHSHHGSLSANPRQRGRRSPPDPGWRRRAD